MYFPFQLSVIILFLLVLSFICLFETRCSFVTGHLAVMYKNVHSYSVYFAECDFRPALYDVLCRVWCTDSSVCYTGSPVDVCVSTVHVWLWEELCVPISVVVAPSECHGLDIFNLSSRNGTGERKRDNALLQGTVSKNVLWRQSYNSICITCVNAINAAYHL